MTAQLAGCIIKDKRGRILLIHRCTADYDHWEVPGGKVEAGETPEQAAIREFREELGVQVITRRELARQTFTDKGRQFEYVWWLSETADTPVIKEPHLFKGYDYFDVAQLLQGDLPLSKGVEALLSLFKAGQITL